jgi:Uma2 family endonuclease
MSANATMTAAEYLAWSEEGDRTQLVEGEVILNEPTPLHASLQMRLSYELESWVRAGTERGLVLFPTDVVMDDFNVFGPDVLWIAERHRPSDLSERLARVPDICIEVRSPGTWRYDIGAKKRVYERGGLPELWLVDDVAATVFVFRRSRIGAQFDVALELTGGDRLGSPQLLGFDLPLERLFVTG